MIPWNTRRLFRRGVKVSRNNLTSGWRLQNKNLINKVGRLWKLTTCYNNILSIFIIIWCLIKRCTIGLYTARHLIEWQDQRILFWRQKSPTLYVIWWASRTCRRSPRLLQQSTLGIVVVPSFQTKCCSVSVEARSSQWDDELLISDCMGRHYASSWCYNYSIQ